MHSFVGGKEYYNIFYIYYYYYYLCVEYQLVCIQLLLRPLFSPNSANFSVLKQEYYYYTIFVTAVVVFTAVVFIINPIHNTQLFFFSFQKKFQI